MSSLSDIPLLYIGYFNRLPDPEGLAFWEDVQDAGFQLSDIAEDFSTQPEAVAIYDYFALEPVGTPEQFLTEVYENLFNRTPDAGGLAFWSSYLNEGGRVGYAILSIIEGAVADDQTTLDAKLDVAELWCAQLEENPDFLFSDAAVFASRNALDQSGLVAASQTEALDDILLFFEKAPALFLDQTLFSMSENADVSSRTKIGEVTVFQSSDDGANIATLTGIDADKFEIDGIEIFLKAGTALDFETQSSLFVNVEVNDPDVGADPDDMSTISLTLRDVAETPETPVTPIVNAAATVTLSNLVTMLPESFDTAARTKVAEIAVTDDGLGTNTLALDGGDAGLFEIDGVELFLIAGTTLDTTANPFLDVIVQVDDTDIIGSPDSTVALAIEVLLSRVLEIAEIETDANASGFVINGTTAGDEFGFSVSDAGDVNGDGFDDLIVGARLADTNGIEAGASYVVFGKKGGAAVELSDVETGTGGYVIYGVSEDDQSGISVSGAGDVNGDGFDDIIVGAEDDDPNGEKSGASFVVFGKGDGTAVELADVEAGTRGFVINGSSAYNQSGGSVSGAGDVNADGLDDLIVGAREAIANFNSYSGVSYVVFGKASGQAVELSDIVTGTGGFAINGAESNDFSGRSVSGAGDVNGDGFDDLIVGAEDADPNGVNSGSSYVVFGKSDGTAVELSVVEAGTGGFVINGDSGGDNSGTSVSSAGDVNGDGFDDLIVGALGEDPGGRLNSASSFVVFGKSDSAAVELSAVKAGTGGFVINGVSPVDYSGSSVSGAGDVNGDGFDDLIVGAYYDDPNGISSGASFVVFGKEDTATVELSDVENGTGGFVINGGSVNDQFGISVSGAGDVNGDGFDDLIVGALHDDPNGVNSGASFVVFGGDFSGAATEIGTTGDDSLIGTVGNDNVFAGTGDDTLTTSAGDDRLSGGNGEDLFVARNVIGTTTIIDFVSDEDDLINVNAFGFANFAALQATFSDHGHGGHDTLIELDADTDIILIGVEMTDLIITDFQP